MLIALTAKASVAAMDNAKVQSVRAIRLIVDLVRGRALIWIKQESRAHS
ncbi:hypothetical protein [Bradyrhizobium jicamae]|nr:hypothetical protein [Bradyrhizobium jicamae]